MKRFVFAFAIKIVVGSALVVCGSAQAQWAVIDAANLQQNYMHYVEQVKTVAQEYEQVKQLVAQLQQAKQQYASITGIRNLGGILLEDYTSISPQDVNGALNIMNGSGASSTYAKTFYQQSNLFGESYFESVPQYIQDDLKRFMTDDANAQGANASVYQSAVQRYQRLSDLRGQIDCTQDLKAIGELQARIQAEQTDAQNELVKLQAMNAMLDANRRIQDKRQIQQDFVITAAKY